MKKILSIVLCMVMLVATFGAIPASAEIENGKPVFINPNVFYIDIETYTDGGCCVWPETQYFVTIDNVVYTYIEGDCGTDNADGKVYKVMPSPDVTKIKIQKEVPDYTDADYNIEIHNADFGIDGTGYGFTYLKEAEIDDGIFYLSNLNNCPSLEKVYIGKDVSNISNCFYNCPNLKEIIIDEENDRLVLEDNALYSVYNGVKTLECVINPEKNYVVKQDVNIVFSPFGINKEFKSIEINHNIKSLYLGNSLGISKINLGENVNKIQKIKLYNLYKLKTLDLSNIKNNYLGLSGCKKLESLTLSPSLKSINYEAFNGCRRLKTLSLPESIKRIRYHAFNDSGIREITIENTEKAPRIHKAAFENTKKGIKFYVKNKKVAKSLKKQLKKSCAKKPEIYIGNKLYK